MHTINLLWEKIKYNQEEISKLSSTVDYGLYQIYGKHPAYGKDALLYIGQAAEQTFASRLYNRWEFIESCAVPQDLRVGRLVKSNLPDEILEWNESDKIQMIDLCERLLLHSHTPAFNKQNNSGLYNTSNGEADIHILNWGDFGDLQFEVSTYRYSYKYWNYDRCIDFNTESLYQFK